MTEITGATPLDGTIRTTRTVSHRRARILSLVVAVVLAATAATFVALDPTAPAPVPAAPSYDGDWKDAFVQQREAGTTVYSGDWKDAFVSEQEARTTGYTGDWKDSLLPDAQR